MSNIKGYYPYGIAYKPLEDHMPWKWHICYACNTAEEALSILKEVKEEYGLVCAWISLERDDGSNDIIFHESYVDILGCQTTTVDLSVLPNGGTK